MISPAEIWDFIRHRPNVPRTLVEIPADHILSPFAGPTPILPEKHYFGIVVDELFLASSRRWGTEYEPMVLAITEFTHAGKPASLPFIVGPKLLGNIPNTQTAAAPEGMLYRQIRVAGIHPFRGGTVVSTVVLCQLRRQDHLRDLLKVVENVAGAVPFGAELGTYTRLADTLLDGIGTLLGNQDTEPLVGIRQDFDHDLGTPIRNAYFALIDGPESRYPRERLWVEERQLRVGPSRERLAPLRDANYVLFSIRGAAEISDLSKLPENAQADTVIGLAASTDARDWERAKAELLVLYRQLLTAPELTRDQAKKWFEDIKGQAIAAHQTAAGLKTLGPAEARVADDLRDAVSLLQLQ